MPAGRSAEHTVLPDSSSDGQSEPPNSKKQKQNAQHSHWLACKRSIIDQIRHLENDIKEDWHDGWQGQSDMMGLATGDIFMWLNSLFEVAIERGLELARTQRYLFFMERAMSRMADNRCRTKYRDHLDWMEEQITDSKGVLMYHGSPEAVFHYFWRDLLLTAFVQEDTAVVKAFCDHRYKSEKLPLSLTDLPKYSYNPLDPERKADDDGAGFQDDWHTDAMRAELPKLHALFTDSRVSDTTV